MLLCWTQARDIYEEAIQTVTTVRDFTQVFDAYAQFEELSLSKRMEEAAGNSNPMEEGKDQKIGLFNFKTDLQHETSNVKLPELLLCLAIKCNSYCGLLGYDTCNWIGVNISEKHAAFFYPEDWGNIFFPKCWYLPNRPKHCNMNLHCNTSRYIIHIIVY